MFARICQIASLLSLFLTLSMLGGSYYAYRFVTSEQFKAKVMNEVLDNVSGMMPKILDNALPDMTGPTIPKFKKPKI
jgi:predicted transcriptional regulator